MNSLMSFDSKSKPPGWRGFVIYLKLLCIYYKDLLYSQVNSIKNESLFFFISCIYKSTKIKELPID